MLIAADARFLDSPEMPVYQAFTEKLLLQLAKDHPNDQFIFFVDKPVELLTTVVPTNVLRVVITPKPKNYWTYKWWFDVRLPLALRKYKPAVFIGSYGLCSCNTSVSQILIVHDLAFRHKYAAHFDHSFLFYKKSKSSITIELQKYTCGVSRGLHIPPYTHIPHLIPLF